MVLSAFIIFIIIFSPTAPKEEHSPQFLHEGFLLFFIAGWFIAQSVFGFWLFLVLGAWVIDGVHTFQLLSLSIPSPSLPFIILGRGLLLWLTGGVLGLFIVWLTQRVRNAIVLVLRNARNRVQLWRLLLLFLLTLLGNLVFGIIIIITILFLEHQILFDYSCFFLFFVWFLRLSVAS